MPSSVDQLAAQALDLPADERVQLLERLLASFEPQTPVQSLWLSEAVRRRDEVRAGTVSMVAGDTALQRVRARVARATRADITD